MGYLSFFFRFISFCLLFFCLYVYFDHLISFASENKGDKAPQEGFEPRFVFFDEGRWWHVEPIFVKWAKCALGMSCAIGSTILSYHVRNNKLLVVIVEVLGKALPFACYSWVAAEPLYDMGAYSLKAYNLHFSDHVLQELNQFFWNFMLYFEDARFLQLKYWSVLEYEKDRYMFISNLTTDARIVIVEERVSCNIEFPREFARFKCTNLKR